MRKGYKGMLDAEYEIDGYCHWCNSPIEVGDYVTIDGNNSNYGEYCEDCNYNTPFSEEFEVIDLDEEVKDENRG